MKIRNIHERTLPGSIEDVAELLDSLSTSNDRLWPHDRWPPMRMDAPLRVGVVGGHGPVRYRVSEYDPGRKIVFSFDKSGLTAGFDGQHYFEVVPIGGQVTLRHVLEARCGLGTWLHWTAVIRPLHDALLEDALDRAERALNPSSSASTPWSLWVRLLRIALRAR
jgi:hypothetical protein